MTTKHSKENQIGQGQQGVSEVEMTRKTALGIGGGCMQVIITINAMMALHRRRGTRELILVVLLGRLATRRKVMAVNEHCTKRIGPARPL
jgi:hypothetical protein